MAQPCTSSSLVLLLIVFLTTSSGILGLPAIGPAAPETGAAQLQRLDSFRQQQQQQQLQQPQLLSPTSKQSAAQDDTVVVIGPGGESRNQIEASLKGLRVPLSVSELLKILDSLPQETLTSSQERRSDSPELKSLSGDEDIDAEASSSEQRTKRDGYGGGGGSGSGSFVSGIAGHVVGSVIGASSGLSRGSSSGSNYGQPHVVYGPPTTTYHHYGKDDLSIWDVKKAIINTVIQAVKAIGGGVLALKGQLVKGGGFLITTTGKITTGAGEAIAGLGKSLAASAVVQQPSPAYNHAGYAYQTAHIIEEHGPTYEVPPHTHIGGYPSSYPSASDVVYTYAYYPSASKYKSQHYQQAEEESESEYSED